MYLYMSMYIYRVAYDGNDEFAREVNLLGDDLRQYSLCKCDYNQEVLHIISISIHILLVYTYY
jgi:hypothetical protein